MSLGRPTKFSLRALKRKGLRGARRLAGSHSGNTIPIVASALVPMLGVIGASVDVGSAYMVKSQLRAAVDAAALAGGTVTGDTERRNQEIEKYFKANFPDGYMRTTQTRFDISPDEAPDPANADTVNLRVEATVRMPTFFLRIFGDNLANFDLNAEAEVATGKKFNALEAILVLDNTGSMASSAGGKGGGSRIQALREAAKTFIDTVYAGDPEAHGSIAIGMIPYTTTVNTGWLVKDQYIHKMPPFTDSRPSSYNPLRWAGCLEAAYTVQDLDTPATVMDEQAYDTNAATPGMAGAPLFMPQLTPPLLIDKWGKGNLYQINTPNTGIWKWLLTTWYHGDKKLAEQSIYNKWGNIDTGELRARWLSANKQGGTNHWHSNWPKPVAWNPAYDTNPGPNADCPAEALPPKWGADPATLKTWINNNNYAVRPGWGTHSNLGMAWAYRMLRAPHLFKDIIPDNPGGKPEVEAIILMTDGNFQFGGNDDELSEGQIERQTTDHQGRPLTIGHGLYTAYRLSEERVLTDKLPGNESVAKDQMELRLQKVCEAARKDGIRVYTIAFKLDNNSAKTKELYRGCATSPRYYFDTADPEMLKEAFRSIAVDLVQLHLVE